MPPAMQLKTFGLPIQLVMVVKDFRNQPIRLKAYHPTHPNTVYCDIRNEYDYHVKKLIPLKFPITPEDSMALELSYADGSQLQLESLKTEVLKSQPLLISADNIEFLRFAETFAEQAGYVKAGVFSDPHNKFQIEYAPEIVYERDGKKYTTPARVDHDTGVVSAAQKDFIRYTIPMRVFILMHERFHYAHNVENESYPDKMAGIVCVRAGFPKDEISYAATKIFSDTEENRQRALELNFAIDNA